MKLEEIHQIRFALEQRFPELIHDPWPAPPRFPSRTLVFMRQCRDVFKALVKMARK